MRAFGTDSLEVLLQDARTLRAQEVDLRERHYGLRDAALQLRLNAVESVDEASQKLSTAD